MAGILSLKPEDEKRLHPEALKWFNDQRVTIQREVPLEELTDDDLNIFLSDGEKREFQTSMDEIAKGLARCINTGRVSPDLLTNIGIGLCLLTFEANSLSPMYTIRLLLKKVYQRKVAKAKQEQRKQEEEERWQTEKAKEEQGRREEVAEAERRQKEEEERWRAACRVINPPIDDAKRYLDCPGEYDEFIEATLEALEVYLKKGEDYLDDSRAFDYRWRLRKINDRKEKERQEIAANIAANEYNQRLNKEKARLKALLCPKRKDQGTTSRSKLRTAAIQARALLSSYLVKKSKILIKQLLISVERS